MTVSPAFPSNAAVVVVVSVLVVVDDVVSAVVVDVTWLQWTFISQSQDRVWLLHNVPDGHVYSYGIKPPQM